ncbi:uncharacterized protein LOC134780779 [Penaeus indicus]|uniref:uncharacterized protein LOC134780779 n=1 Tax=Penaeus indicus TaxID=29960 RepID=UPI00300D5F14
MHRIFHPDTEIQHQTAANGWKLITCSAEKNNKNASIGDVGLLMSPQAYKSLIKAEKANSRIIQATFEGNPKTTILPCYSPTNACNDEERDSFYTQLSETIRSLPKHNIHIIGGDMNAKIKPEDCGGYAYNKKTKENCQALMMLLNTKFQKCKGKLWTFIYPSNEKAQLDYILINRKKQNSAIN